MWAHNWAHRFTHWILGVNEPEAAGMECSWAPLSFAFQIVAKLICFCLCLLDAIVELHASILEKILNGFFFGK